MNKQPEIMMGSVPASSPYYHRVVSLNRQASALAAGSPRRKMLEMEIRELTQRAERRRQADMNL